MSHQILLEFYNLDYSDNRDMCCSRIMTDTSKYHNCSDPYLQQ